MLSFMLSNQKARLLINVSFLSKSYQSYNKTYILRTFYTENKQSIFKYTKKNLFNTNSIKNQSYQNGIKFRLFGNMGSRGHAHNSTNIPNYGKRIKEMSTFDIISKLFNFIWPKNNSKIKLRVIIALALLFGSKILNVTVPFFFKEIVDFLNKNTKIKDFGDSIEEKILVALIALIIGYGAARAGASLFGELRSAIFATVAQSSVTKLATQVFRHLHKLDLNFHLNRYLY
jgi:hypothetical protein